MAPSQQAAASGSSSHPPHKTLVQIVQTLQFGWFVGHVTLLLCALRYSLSYITFNWSSKWATFSYRTAFVAAAITYGIVVFKAYRVQARAGNVNQRLILAILGDENTQYLLMALVWLFAIQIPLAILPFAVYSLFHMCTYTRSTLIPLWQPPAQTGTTPEGRPIYKASALSDSIGRFVKLYYEQSMGLVAALEVLVWFRILLSAVIFTKGSWILLMLYTVFLRARYAQNVFIQNTVRQFAARVDSQLANQSAPPAARNAWETVKSTLRTITDATDVRKYLGGAAPPVQKKAR